MEGWVKIHKKIMKWEWYTDANTYRLFTHCLYKANYKDTKWRGMVIPRGQFMTSIDTLSEELQLTGNQIRGAIKKLESTGEIKSITKARGRFLQILSYDTFQENVEKTTGSNTGLTTGSESPTDTMDGDFEVIEENKTTGSNTGLTTGSPQAHHRLTTAAKEVKKLRSKEKDNNHSSSSSIPCLKIMQLFKESFEGTGIPLPKGLSSTRKTKLKKLWSSYPDYQKPEAWMGLFDYIKQSDFLMNRLNSDKGTPFKIDFLLNETNFLKIIEGNYQNDRPVL